MDSMSVQRRLAAILAADVVGYSRLMQGDEIGTLEALKAHRCELLEPAIAAHHGRIVKTTGDGALVEFASVVDAVGCAVVVQRGMVTRNASVADEQRIVFRIGINVGDIIIDGGDIFGDGVNIAARLEALCEPGGVCISRAANDQIRDKLSLAFADLGEQAVKNISRAVGVFMLAGPIGTAANLAMGHRAGGLVTFNPISIVSTTSGLVVWAGQAYGDYQTTTYITGTAAGYANDALKVALNDFSHRLDSESEDIAHRLTVRREEVAGPSTPEEEPDPTLLDRALNPAKAGVRAAGTAASKAGEAVDNLFDSVFGSGKKDEKKDEKPN